MPAIVAQIIDKWLPSQGGSLHIPFSSFLHPEYSTKEQAFHMQKTFVYLVHASCKSTDYRQIDIQSKENFAYSIQHFLST